MHASSRILLSGIALLALLMAEPSNASTTATATSEAQPGDAGTASADASPAPLPSLDDGIASFGAAVAGDALYVYGGHIGRTHQHSVDNLSHHFRSLDLRDPSTGWQSLPGSNDDGSVRGLQGLALVAHGTRVCRVGGLDARNAKGEPEDLISIDEVICYDPANRTWTALPPLPMPRSSHDAAVDGDRLYVGGGWQLRGAGNEPVWHRDLLVLDLAAETPAWRSIEQPFEPRRALTVAVLDGKVHVMGGLGAEGTSTRVDVYDAIADRWHEGPALPAPEGRMKGFGASAFTIDGRILLSLSDGTVHALAAGADAWDTVGQLETQRFFHRLLPHDDRVLFVGGANREGHLADVESLPLAGMIAAAATATIDAPAATTTDASAVVGDASPIAASGPTARWAGFHGPHGDGHAPSAALPVRWSATSGVRWQTATPGYGQSAPVVWDGQVLLTSVAGEKKETLLISAFDADDGEVRWRRRFDASRAEPNTDMYSRAAPTPVVDAERIYALWESGDLIAFGHDGAVDWRVALTPMYGDFVGNHGLASSPVLVGARVIVQITHGGPSYVVAFDRASGEVAWKTDLPEGTSWTTPIVLDDPSGPQLLVSAAGRIDALDADDGTLLWRREALEKNHVPSAVVAGDLIVVPSTAANQTLALRRGGDADDALLWRVKGAASGFGSPVMHGDCVLLANKAGVVSCLDRGDGTARWQHRLADAIWASPIVAGPHAYFFAKNGTTTVLRHGEAGPEVVAENALPTDDRVYGVAAVEGAFFVRTGATLIAVAGADGATDGAGTATR
ncbi:MAG: PQQ-binding-like beta-propeller repeat protein [Acidobacteriota bacterium]